MTTIPQTKKYKFCMIAIVMTLSGCNEYDLNTSGKTNKLSDISRDYQIFSKIIASNGFPCINKLSSDKVICEQQELFHETREVKILYILNDVENISQSIFKSSWKASDRLASINHCLSLSFRDQIASQDASITETTLTVIDKDNYGNQIIIVKCQTETVCYLYIEAILSHNWFR
jgi:hypothetical protein